MRHQRIDWDLLRADVVRLGVSQACHLHGIHRSWWYRRLNSSPPTGRASPVRVELEGAILEIARERPRWGCDRIAYFLLLEGKKVSSPTVQKILLAHGLGDRQSRIRQAEIQPSPSEESA